MIKYIFWLGLLVLAACAPREVAPANTPVPLTATPVTATDPNDTDGDGVPNDADRCEGAITGADGADATGCPDQFDPYVNLTYNHEPHELWYRRFWTGSCEGVPGFCLPGDPAWFDITDQVVAEYPPEQKGVIRNRLWAVGRAIGYDWASDPEINTDKQITTRQLRAWGNNMQNTDDFPATLTSIEAEICEQLGPAALLGDFSPAESCQT